MRVFAMVLLILGCGRAASISTDNGGAPADAGLGPADAGTTSRFLEIGPGFAQAMSPSGLVGGITGVGQGTNFIYDARAGSREYLPGLGCDVFAINDAG